MLLALGALLAALPASAGLFGDKRDEPKAPQGPKVRYDYHLHIPDKVTEQEFLQLFGEKKALNEDLIVLHRLNEQKAAQYAELQKMLMDQFAVLPESMYQYDRDTATIYELVPEPKTLNVHDEPAPEADPVQAQRGPYLRQVLKQLEDEAQGNRFLELLRQKKLIHNELTVLRALVIQKQLGLKRVNDTLLAKFSLSPDGMYHYDAEEMALYEILPAGKK
jgi:hypothetical protein